MEPEPSSTRREPPPLVPLDQIAYIAQNGQSILTSAGPAILRGPDVIVGHDVVTGSETVFYGRDLLERILETGHAEGQAVESDPGPRE
jgi:hypothetical protein